MLMAESNMTPRYLTIGTDSIVVYAFAVFIPLQYDHLLVRLIVLAALVTLCCLSVCLSVFLSLSLSLSLITEPLYYNQNWFCLCVY